jgi:SAM-dependent methyltransferase
MRAYARLIRLFRDSGAMAADDFRQFQELMVRLGHHTELDLARARVLEIGCGQRYAVTLLMHSFGAHVTGIDTAFVGPRFRVLDRHVWKQNGFERTIKTAVRRALYDRRYYHHLADLAGRNIMSRDVDLRVMDSNCLAFGANTFDLVYSCATFEHILEVSKATAEMHRVLKPGGVAFLSIHLFPSLTGGHSLDWRDPEVSRLRSVPAWDHLRSALYPESVTLNGLRESDYVALFQARFLILELTSKYEGEEYLTRDIEKECSDYSREELLKSNINIVLRKEGRAGI